MKYGVRSIPTLMLFKDGQLQAQHVGMLSARPAGPAAGCAAVRGYLGNSARGRSNKQQIGSACQG